MNVFGVRFGKEQLAFVAREAQIEGVSISQFIRDAASARAVMLCAQRHGLTMQLLSTLIETTEYEGADVLAAQLRALVAELED